MKEMQQTAQTIRQGYNTEHGATYRSSTVGLRDASVRNSTHAREKGRIKRNSNTGRFVEKPYSDTRLENKTKPHKHV